MIRFRRVNYRLSDVSAVSAGMRAGISGLWSVRAAMLAFVALSVGPVMAPAQAAAPVPPAAKVWHVADRAGVDRTQSADVRERAAASLYGDAQAYANLSEWEAAQRILEVIVRRYPETRTAALARRDMRRFVERFAVSGHRFSLGGLDDGGRGTPRLAEPLDGADVKLPKRGPKREQGPGADKRPDKRSGTPTIGEWFVRVAPSAPLQDRLRAEVGDRVFFSAHSAKLGQRSQVLLQSIAQWLKRNPSVGILVEGHADEPGGDTKTNDRFSRARAIAVRKMLITNGVAPNRVRTVGVGRAQPVALCNSGACQAQNRRTVVRLMAPKTATNSR
ncbi:MAG: OmpA family protein [Pseudomonadota bacterium]